MLEIQKLALKKEKAEEVCGGGGRIELLIPGKYIVSGHAEVQICLDKI